MWPIPNVEKYATDAKRGKTFNRCQARENARYSTEWKPVEATIGWAQLFLDGLINKPRVCFNWSKYVARIFRKFHAIESKGKTKIWIEKTAEKRICIA